MRPDPDEEDDDDFEEEDDELEDEEDEYDDEDDDEDDEDDEDDDEEDDEDDGDEDGDDDFEESDFVEGSTFALGVAISDSPRWDPCSVAVRAHADEGAYRALLDASIEQHEVEDALEHDQSARSLAHALLVEHVESSFAVEDDPPSWQLCTVEVDAATFRRRNELGFEELRALPGAVVEVLPEEDGDGDEDEDEDED